MELQMSGPKFQLNTGDFIPALGMGTVNLHTEARGLELVKDAVLSAIKVGYRHIDTAVTYNSEVAIGNALQEAFKEGIVKRADVFVTTKVWAHNLTPDGVFSSLQISLGMLQLEYVDLLLMHMPVRIKPGVKFHQVTREDILPMDLKAVWEAYEHVLHLGLTKAIGVSNFCVKKLQELFLYAKHVPAVNQVELHPYCQQAKLRAFCNKRGIHVTCWSPIMAPNTFYGSKSLLDNPTLKEIAVKHGKSVAQICLRWCVEIGCSAVPKSYNQQRQRENFNIFDFELTNEDHERILALPQHKVHHEHDRKTFAGAYIIYDELWDDTEGEISTSSLGTFR